MADEQNGPKRPSRRAVLASLGALGVAGVAGCGAGDTDPTTTAQSSTVAAGTTTGVSTARSTTREQTPGTSTGERTTSASGPVEDPTWRLYVPPPTPADVGYNPLAPDSFWFEGRNMMRLDLFARSSIDRRLYSEAARDWNYGSGTLTVEVHDDLYWVAADDDGGSPVNVTASDWTSATWLLGELFRPETPFERIEALGSHRFRVHFGTPLRREYALEPSRLGVLPRAFNATFWQAHLDVIRDASSGDALESGLADARSREVNVPGPVTNMPFRVSGTGADRWELSLRSDEDPTPRWVDALTFESAAVVVRPDRDQRRAAFPSDRQAFWGTGDMAEGSDVYGGGDAPASNGLLADSAFANAADTTVRIPQRVTSGCLILDTVTPPTDDVHFRRAIAYLLDRGAHRTSTMVGDRLLTGFTTESEERQYLSEDLLATLESGPHANFGYDESMTAEAAAELTAGDYQRDSEGRWLHQTGSDQGEPIHLSVIAYPSMDRLVNATTPFFDEVLPSFGIDTSVRVLSQAERTRRLATREYDVLLGHWGEHLPADVYRTLYSFVDGRSTGFPDRWTGPPVGEFATPPTAATDATERYEITSMLSEQSTANQPTTQSNVDRLAWVFNQSLSRIPIGREPWYFGLDTDRWVWPLPIEDNPAAWASLPHRKLWQRGFVRSRSG